MLKKAALFALIVLAGLLLFGIASRTKLAYLDQTFLAQVGVSVGVLPNQYNTLNDQLNQKAAYLDERQAYLDAQQAALASSTAALNSPSGNPYLAYLTVAIAGLAVLVLLNFYFDWRRSRRKEKSSSGPPAVPPAAA